MAEAHRLTETLPKNSLETSREGSHAAEAFKQSLRLFCFFLSYHSVGTNFPAWSSVRASIRLLRSNTESTPSR